MAAQNGKDLLIKLDITGSGSFTTIAGLRATRISFNAESVDVTSLESQGGWRELLGGAGVKSATISGSGVFRDDATDERARQIFFDGETPAFQVIIPDFGVVEGPSSPRPARSPSPRRPDGGRDGPRGAGGDGGGAGERLVAQATRAGSTGRRCCAPGSRASGSGPISSGG